MTRKEGGVVADGLQAWVVHHLVVVVVVKKRVVMVMVMVMKKRRVTLANLHGDELGAVGHHVEVCPHALVLGEHLKVFIVSM